jgi:(2Fe-2S) ferredoxin/predicted TPR repeat methyltransferase
MHMMLCGGTGCIASGTPAVKQALEEELVKRGLHEEVQVIITGCNGFCAMGPIMTVFPDGIFYNKLKPEHVPRLVEEHVLKGRPVKELLFEEPLEKEKVPLLKDIGFFGNQRLIALRNRGLIDAEKIDEYISNGNRLVSLGRYDEAIKNYVDALNLDPRDSRVLYNLATAQMLAKRYSDAVRSYTQVTIINPNDAESFLYLGVCHFNSGRNDLAKDSWKKTLELDPKNETAKNYLNILGI